MVLILALGIPLTVNLQQRATSDLEREALIEAQGVAAQIGVENIGAPKRLDRIVSQARDQLGGRWIVVDDQGILVADSEGPASLGTPYATTGRPEIGHALQGTPFSEIRDSVDLGHDIMATAVPIQDEQRLVGAVRLTRSVQQVNDNVRNVTLGLAAIGVAALVAGMLLAFGLAGSLSRPLTRLAAAAKRLGEGDLSTRAGDVGGAREVEELGQSFDEMADRLERSAQAQREFVANASHQLRTPLTAMKLRLEGAIEEAPDEELRGRLEAADREVDRLSGIVDRLLVMAREIEEGTSAHVDLREAADRAAARWNERAGDRDSTVVARGEGGSARVDPTDLDQILDNLLDNATSYAPGEVTIESGGSNGRVFVAVEDRGPGIASEDLARVTERFYRGHGVPSGGSGLGLAIARQLVEKWGGTLSVESSRAEGTRVEVRLDTAP
ncbi:MAG: HAMP domain-containing sensor histidine kinase [Actinomycetota bacterium]